MLNVGRWAVDEYAPVPLTLMSAYDFIKTQIVEQEDRKQFQDVVPRTAIQQGIKTFTGVNTMTYDPTATEKQRLKDRIS